MKNILSKLKKLELRQVWKHEALDFTNWLAEKDNLDALSEAIGVDIKLIQTEASVGKFNVDILAEEDLTGKKIIIENAKNLGLSTSAYCRLVLLKNSKDRLLEDIS